MIEYFKVYGGMKNAYGVYLNGTNIGVVFKWGKVWCSNSFPPFIYCKTRHEAADRLAKEKKNENSL